MAGYDIGVSLSGTSTSGASLNSPFSVNGGGRGSAAVKPGNVTVWLILGVVALAGLFFFSRR
jgi:hypothetical protein